jgi:hypothetical protein
MKMVRPKREVKVKGQEGGLLLRRSSHLSFFRWILPPYQNRRLPRWTYYAHLSMALSSSDAVYFLPLI